jgi:hypothetical protein
MAKTVFSSLGEVLQRFFVEMNAAFTSWSSVFRRAAHNEH